MKGIFQSLFFVFFMFVSSMVCADIVIDEGPVWNPPGMGTEEVSGATASVGGETYTYTGMDLSKTDSLYYGIKNDAYLCGFSMDGGGISGSEIFTFSTASTNSITYVGSTIIETLPGPAQYVDNTRMTLTFTGPGSIILDSTTAALGNESCDVGALWRVEGDFSVNILMEAQVVQPGDSNFGDWEAGNDLFNRLETVGVSAFGTAASIDTGFFYEYLDSDSDGILDDGDGSGIVGDNLCVGGATLNCDDNCINTPNSDQADIDMDGVGDVCDNCTEVANSDQRDTDSDLYGNICDADLNNDGGINFADMGLLRQRLFTADPDADFNGDGGVNFTDMGILRNSLFGEPGPSGLIP